MRSRYAPGESAHDAFTNLGLFIKQAQSRGILHPDLTLALPWNWVCFTGSIKWEYPRLLALTKVRGFRFAVIGAANGLFTPRLLRLLILREVCKKVDAPWKLYAKHEIRETKWWKAIYARKLKASEKNALIWKHRSSWRRWQLVQRCGD